MYSLYYLKDRSLVKKGNRSNHIQSHGRIHLSKIKIKGENNYILLDKKTNLRKSDIFIQGNNNKIICGKNCDLNKLKIKMLTDNTILKIGDFTSTGQVDIILEENFNISIGNNCMFSYGIEIRNSDSHKILNDSLERINKGKEIIIEDNVWVGTRVMILKGTHIKNSAVIGACSLVNSLIDEKSLAAGYPAKIIKQNITWER